MAEGAPVTYLKFAGPVLDEATIEGVTEVLRSGQLSSGPWVQRFERDLSAFCGERPVRVLTSATAAIEVALQLCGIGPGDEVITGTQSFFTVLNMIVKVGAKPVFVDCDLVTRNIDLAQVEAAITPATRAIIPTHYPGAMVDMDALLALARRHRLRVIEDAALVIGSRWKNRNVGAFGDLVSFSFHPNKNMTSIEGGALVVNDASEAARVEVLRFHGIEYLKDRTRDVSFPGGKFNMPDVNARIGAHQLGRLPEFLAKRRALANRYFARLATDSVMYPAADAGNAGRRGLFVEHVLHPPAARRACRSIASNSAMRSRHAESAPVSPTKLSTSARSDDRYGGREGQFPNAERIARETVSLPLHAGMTEADVDRVCGAVADVIAGAAIAPDRGR